MTALADRLHASGQGHLVAALDRLSGAERDHLAVQIETVDLDEVSRLVRELVLGDAPIDVGDLQPARIVALPTTASEHAEEEAAHALGEERLRDGFIAAVLVAGGQGTRLGFDGPKGAFPFAPTGTILFAHHAAKVQAIRRRYDCAFPWYIMTSPQNDDETRAIFAAHDNFGLDPETVVIFPQGTMPAVDRDNGQILLAAPDSLALSPDGHGGMFRALARHDLLGHMRALGVETFVTFQVDNPMLRLARPAFLGYHTLHQAQMSNIVVRKASPDERVGVVATRGDSNVLVEYSDLPDELAAARDADGGLRFWGGSIAAHAIDVDLAESVVRDDLGLPFHKAIKAVPHIDSSGALVQPPAPNAVKFETFIFDALPFATSVVSVESPRDQEFSPIKNATGDDSPETTRRDLNRLYAGWLEAAGVAVPRDSDGNPTINIEIDPNYALDAAELTARVPTDLPLSDPLVLRNR